MIRKITSLALAEAGLAALIQRIEAAAPASFSLPTHYVLQIDTPQKPKQQ